MLRELGELQPCVPHVANTRANCEAICCNSRNKFPSVKSDLCRDASFAEPLPALGANPDHRCSHVVNVFIVKFYFQIFVGGVNVLLQIERYLTRMKDVHRETHN